MNSLHHDRSLTPVSPPEGEGYGSSLRVIRVNGESR